jgi:predicted O-linked N-acetylglucosamine transferase (SPINDLY family)
VSGSVLHAAGVPELVASSADEYRALIQSLAVDAPRRARLRKLLTEDRHCGALFDNVRFTRALERAYQEMVRRAREHSTPDHLWID